MLESQHYVQQNKILVNKAQLSPFFLICTPNKIPADVLENELLRAFLEIRQTLLSEY